VTESALLSADVGAAMSLREMAYSWQSEPPTERAQSLEILIKRGLHMANGLQMAWSLASENARVWESGSYLRRVQALDFLATVVLDMLSRTREILAGMDKNQPAADALPEGSADVESIYQQVRELSTSIRETLNRLNQGRPPVNQEMLRRSRESYDRGDGGPISDIIARLESGGSLVQG
jgi:hypothetical protein